MTRSGLPTGTVAFLFTDIEGSSRRWDKHGETMDAAVRRHDEILRAAIGDHDGTVFKTVGDAFCAAFWNAADAARAAIDAQRALEAEDFAKVDGLRVRVGVHVGETAERERDYFGPVVNRVARLMSIGHGGQILLSGAARDAVHATLPAGVSLTDLGLRRLKDLTQPEHVWQVTIEDLPHIFPPLDSLDARPNNLPFETTSFRGRETDLKEIETLVGRTRLLTLAGAGGIGKTRLALQAGADLLDHFRDGVWFVELANVTDGALVAESAAATVGASADTQRAPLEAIVEHFRRKQALLILDNCEHVLEHAAELAASILRQCGEVRMLATSRQALGVSGETAYRVASLSVPDKAAGLTAAEAATFGAVALFVDRAQAVNTRFELTDENAPGVAEICKRIDGIALAIELAAARCKVLSVARLVELLDERLRVLTDGARSASPRQRTLRALIDWSHDLLSGPEQMLFRRSAIFVGGFSLTAATRVCAGDGLSELEILDLISSLADKSLIVPEIGVDVECFRLIESTREYALEKLDGSGERDRIAQMHASYFSDVALAIDSETSSAKGVRFEIDADNYRSALSWALDQRNDVILGAKLAGVMSFFWSDNSHVEGLRWARTALEMLGDEPPDDVAGRLWLTVAQFTDGQKGFEASFRAEALYRRVGDLERLASARYYLGFALYQLGRYEEAEAAYRQALAVARDSGDQGRVATSLNGLASALFMRGDIDGPRRCYDEALEVHTSTGNASGRSAVLGNLAELEFAQGNVDKAIVHAVESLNIELNGNNASAKAIGYINLCAYRIRDGQLEQARTDGRKGLAYAIEAQNPLYVGHAAQHMALVGALMGDPQRAARIVGYVDRVYEEVGAAREPTELWSYETLNAALRGHLTEADAQSLKAQGASWSQERAAQEALEL